MDENKVDFEKMTPAERLKYEVAEEIGLADKVRQYGWRSLTAKETVRSVTYHHAWNAKTFYTFEVPEIKTGTHAGFLFQSHLSNQFF